MTALQQVPTTMTVSDYLALGQSNDGPRTELQEGALVMVPSPTPFHNRGYLQVCVALQARLAQGLRIVPDVDLDLHLVPDGGPGTVRRPDVVVVRAEEYDRVCREGGVLRAGGAVLVVEIVSPSSRRTDRVVKRAEYADAGIPHYWIIDLDPPVSLVACHLAEGFGYRDSAAVTGTFAAQEPFPVTLELDSLVDAPPVR